MADVINKTTLVYLKSVNTPDYIDGNWIINPDLSSLSGVDKKYWKVDGETIVEMTQPEKDVVDAAKETVDDTKEIKRLHSLAWDYVHNWYDEGGLLQVADWKHDFPNDTVLQDLIDAINTWKNAVMLEYLMVKKVAVQTNGAYDDDYSFIGDCPVTFTDLFLYMNPGLQPNGWSAPDVSSYTPGTR